MNIKFFGACDGITGSCHLVDTGRVKFLIDCGMFQGGPEDDAKNYEPFGFDPKKIDFLILTHAHTDHCGRLPKLFKDGFSGPVYATAPTKDFTEIMLQDAAQILFNEALENHTLPLYLLEDVQQAMANFSVIAYRKKKLVAPGIEIRFRDAGHVLGSAFVEIFINEAGKTKTIVFSGDIGNPPVPLLEHTEKANGADALILESTYGGRIHEPANLRQKLLQEAFIKTVSRGGVLMIPSFALERTQQILYEFNSLVENKMVPSVPIYLDSPLAIKATDIYQKYGLLFDKEAKDLIATGDNLFDFPNLHFTSSSLESKKIHRTPGPKVIIAGSGMCNGGRILHHLKKYLPDPKNHLLFVGYQAHNTLGRYLYDGAQYVNIGDRRVIVRASKSAIGSYSAHADQPKLINWLAAVKKPKPKQVFLVHGEDHAKLTLADGIKDNLKLNTTIPEIGKEYKVL